MVDVIVPNVGESISEVQIGQWLKSEGDWVAAGEDVVEIETEKASVQIPATSSGILTGIRKRQEEFAMVGEVIATIEPAVKGEVIASIEPAVKVEAPASTATHATIVPPSAEPSQNSVGTESDAVVAGNVEAGSNTNGFVMPAAQRLLDDLGLSADQIPATGPGGRLLKEDVQRFVSRGSTASSAPVSSSPPTVSTTPVVAKPAVRQAIATAVPTPSSLLTTQPGRSEELKPMSMLRRTIAARLVQAQQTAALLTTFNEVDMKPVMQLRQKYRDGFLERHGVKLGFMSFFAKAAVDALRRFPAVNAEIRGNSIAYRHYQDIGVAIGGGKGLVVPVLRNVERMSFADIERAISDFAAAAGDNRLQPQDLEGGTFTISNGGIYGSLLSTPIVNPPQSGILGLHSIQERPIAFDGQVVIRPMMYLALTYDHRIVDGREAVGFLKTIKDVIEDPSRLFLEV